MLAPLAPFIAEELWAQLGGRYSVHQQAWPVWDEELAAEETVTLPVQVNGRVRDRITVPVSTPKDEVKQLALRSENVARHLDGKKVIKVIVVPGRVVNIVAR
jgi:leucyl-tRNA synthetase